MKILIVGAGLYGAVCARELKDAGHDVVMLEKSKRIGGHVKTRWHEEAQCHVHEHGPHIFHTNNAALWEYATKFALFHSFINRPKAWVDGKLYSLPINLMTISQVLGASTPLAAKRAIERDCIKGDGDPKNMEQWCLSNIGVTLYQMFIEGYTLKQWGKHPRELPATIIKRLPVRFDCNDSYYDHAYQGIPIEGYSAWVAAMLKGIKVETGVNFLDNVDHWIDHSDRVIYTGPIDAFFEHALGTLEYRTLSFVEHVEDVADANGNAVINLPSVSDPRTRIVEHKHFMPSPGSSKTVLTWEYPRACGKDDEPYYPVPTPENLQLYARYQDLAKRAAPTVEFGGRLGLYRYLDMDAVIALALAKVKEVTCLH